jgi:p24 family protein delta-1
LKPIEVELRRIEDVISEIVHDMEYLKIREQTMRNTNESTNERVKGFAILTSIHPLYHLWILMIGLVLLGLSIWQIVYLRTYFQRKGMLE